MLCQRLNPYRITSGLRVTSTEAALIEGEMLRVKYMAQSLLTGVNFRDGSSVCPPLTLDQAYDVMKWAKDYRWLS